MLLFNGCCVELLADVLKDKPQLDLSTDAIIVVDNVPKVNPDRLPKLENVLNKVFSKFGTIVSHYHPKDENGTTKGWVGGRGQMGGASPQWFIFVLSMLHAAPCRVWWSLSIWLNFGVLCLCCVVVCSYFFLEFANSEQAEQAVKASNGYRLDKSHIFVVNHFSDFDK